MTGADTSSQVWLVVGLGNPGSSYSGHRHNVGYLVVDALAERMSARFRAHKSRLADVVEGRFTPAGAPGPRVVLMKSRAHMNVLGGSVNKVAGFYGVSPERVIVIHDELDIDFGTLRIKWGGGDNGHNGLRSIRAAIATGDFYRVRAGIGRPPGSQSVSDFVLSNYSASERKEVSLQIVEAADAVESLVLRGLSVTQQDFNR